MKRRRKEPFTYRACYISRDGFPRYASIHVEAASMNAAFAAAAVQARRLAQECPGQDLDREELFGLEFYARGERLHAHDTPEYIAAEKAMKELLPPIPVPAACQCATP